MAFVRKLRNRAADLLARRRSRAGSSDFGARLDSSRNQAHRRGDTTQQGPTWGGGPF